LKAVTQTDGHVTASPPASVAPALRSLPRVDEEKFAAANSSTRVLDATLINPLAGTEWDDLIRTHSDATIFHSTAWGRVLADTYGHQPCYVQMSLNGNLFALIPMMEVQTILTKSRGICLPFSDCCAPLIFSNFGTELVIQKLQQIGRERGWNYFELRDRSIVSDDVPASETYYSHSLDLSIGREAVTSNFSNSVARAVRKAQRNGLSVNIRSDPAAMDQFYRLHVRTRRRHGVPPQPRSFFGSIQKNLIKPGHGFIVIVQRREAPVAAAVFFRFGGHAVYKFGASDERLQELRSNNLAMFEAIRYLADDGVQTLHLGRTEKNNEGLRRFKLSWGATEGEIGYVRFEMANGSWKRSHGRPAIHKPIFRALPVSLNRLAGAIIYPHLD
jgi:Acetyltransferase (GNAT) domain